MVGNTWEAWGGVMRESRGGRMFSTLTLSFLVLLGGLLVGILLSKGTITLSAAVIGGCILTIMLVLRKNEALVGLVLIAHIYIDWYLGSLFDAQLLTIVLLTLFYLMRSPQHPWDYPRLPWLWLLFLVVGIFPAIQGAWRLYDIAFYYPNIIGGALVTFWLGTVVAKDVASLRRVVQILAFIGALLALHTIIEGNTGIVLFGTSRFDEFLARAQGYELATGLNVHRIGSFFVDPNWNGTFLATMLFLPLGLFMESSTVMGKLFYLVEIFLILPALLFTYSNGAWVGVLGGSIIFFFLAGRVADKVLIIAMAGIASILGTLLFSYQINLQLQHASGATELTLRQGAWQTGINVIQAFPLTGVGLGFDVYLQKANAYRDPRQYLALDHPHNSYIEIAAKAGLPMLLLFFALLSFALWQAFRNRRLFEKRTRSLFGGGIAAIIALSVNSVSINAWTLPPISALGWIILGIMASPLLVKSLTQSTQKVQSVQVQATINVVEEIKEGIRS